MKDIRVAIAQVPAILGNKERNIGKIREIAGEVREYDLLIFPELFLTGYNIRNEVFRLAEPIDGKSVKEVSEIAENNGIHIIFGMPERDGDAVYNSAVLVEPDGKIHRYRKIMLPNFGPFEEGLYYTAGKELPVFDTALGKIAIEICYDLFYPEISKAFAGKGAEIIVNISGSPSISRALFERLLPARAIETGTYFLYSNNIGTQLGLVFWGGSRAISPKGEIISKGEAYEEGIVTAELSADYLRVIRENRPIYRDSRPEIMEEMLRSWSH